MDDFILLEYSWQMVQTSVEASVSALRGVFNLMASSESGSSLLTGERLAGQNGHGRTGSVSSTTSSLFKRLSTVLGHPHAPAPPPTARSSFSANPSAMRYSVTQSFPTNMPSSQSIACHTFQRKLSTIPPTPFEVNVINPFDTNFKGEASSPYTLEQQMAEERSPLDMGPMSTAVANPIGDCKPFDNPTFFRRLSRNLGPAPIAV